MNNSSYILVQTTHEQVVNITNKFFFLDKILRGPMAFGRGYVGPTYLGFWGSMTWRPPL